MTEYAFEVKLISKPTDCVGCEKTIEDVRAVFLITDNESEFPFHQQCLDDLGWSIVYFVHHYEVDQEVKGGIN